MHSSKVLKRFKMVLLIPIGFILPIHFSESPSKFNGILRNLNSIPSPIYFNSHHIKSNRKPKHFEKEPH